MVAVGRSLWVGSVGWPLWIGYLGSVVVGWLLWVGCSLLCVRCYVDQLHCVRHCGSVTVLVGCYDLVAVIWSLVL